MPSDPSPSLPHRPTIGTEFVAGPVDLSIPTCDTPFQQASPGDCLCLQGRKEAVLIAVLQSELT